MLMAMPINLYKPINHLPSITMPSFASMGVRQDYSCTTETEMGVCFFSISPHFPFLFLQNVVETVSFPIIELCMQILLFSTLAGVNK